jgi:hypothetical protein
MFDETCTSLRLAREAQGHDGRPDAPFIACLDAMFAASLDLEVIQEVMRIEGNFPPGVIDLTHLHLDVFQADVCTNSLHDHRRYVFAAFSETGEGNQSLEPGIQA